MSKRRTYSKEFKLDVIKQSYQRDNIRELADELGIDPGLIYAWRSKYKQQPQQAFPGKGIPSRSRVARLMRKEGIQSQIRPKWVATTDSKHQLPVAPNLLDQDFTTDRLGQVWVSDITYIPSSQGWLYLTTIMDLADRQILGWSFSEGMRADQTVIPAWRQACQKRAIDQKLIFHSDRGIQYACEEFCQLLEARPLARQSMSRKGNCWDNAPAESFFKTFKAELPIEPKHYSYEILRGVIFNFIEIWYNRQRLHSTLDYRTPTEMQDYLTQQQELAA